MKSKQLIRFYFSEGGLNRALDNLILTAALKSAETVGKSEYFAERILTLIEVKKELGRLWSYLDAVISALPEKDRAVLKYYGGLRAGLSALDADTVREIKRVRIKFIRRARRIDSFGEGVKLLKEYYCLCRACGED